MQIINELFKILLLLFDKSNNINQNLFLERVSDSSSNII